MSKKFTNFAAFLHSKVYFGIEFVHHNNKKKYIKLKENMYVAKPIPTLTGEAADRFMNLMESAEQAPKRDLSAARNAYKTIMERSARI